MNVVPWLYFVRMGVRYALHAEVLVGVVPRPLATRVPGAPPQVIGLVAWRGGVLPLLEPGADFDGRDPDDTQLQAIVIVRAGSGLIALAADRIHDREQDAHDVLVVDPVETLARCRNRISAMPPEPHYG